MEETTENAPLWVNDGRLYQRTYVVGSAAESKKQECVQKTVLATIENGSFIIHTN